MIVEAELSVNVPCKCNVPLNVRLLMGVVPVGAVTVYEGRESERFPSGGAVARLAAR